MKWLWHWVVSALALLIVAGLFQNIWFDSITAAFVTAAVLGVINAVVRPILQLLSLPVTILTFGLFALVINAVLLEVTAGLVKGFHVQGFSTAFFASIVLSIVGAILHAVLKSD
ncbi:MAG: phage holin family protein [Tumebacillaceae bacterium]